MKRLIKTIRTYPFFPLLLFALLSPAISLANSPLSFIFFGDAGMGNSPQMQVAAGLKTFCQKNPCEFVAFLGDNFYPDGVKNVHDPLFKEYFQKPYGSLGIVFHPALGNHDYRQNFAAQIEYSQYSDSWDFPHRYYQFRKKDVDFFVIDTENFDEIQAEWLRVKILLSKAQWKIVYGHHPLISYGKHKHIKKKIRKLRPFLSGKVDFYLSGHDHSKQVIQGEKDLIHIISGTGGAKPNEVKKGEKSFFAANSFGFSYLQIYPQSAHLKILDSQGIVEFEKVFAKRKRDRPGDP